MGKLMVVILKIVRKCKIYQTYGSQVSPISWYSAEKFAHGLLEGDGSAWN